MSKQKKKAETEIEDAQKDVGRVGIKIVNEAIRFNGGDAGRMCKSCNVTFREVEEFAVHRVVEHEKSKKLWRTECSCKGGLTFVKYSEAFLHMKQEHFCGFDRCLYNEICNHDACQAMRGQPQQEI